LNRNLTFQLTHELGSEIVKGTYPSGAIMPSEAVISERYDVSRSSTREAVKMLSAKGLISSRPRQGIRVEDETKWNLFDPDVLNWILQSKPSLQLLREFTQVRYAIEPVAAKLAAENADETNIQELESALHRIAEAQMGLDDQLDAHISFLNAILNASGNRFFIQLTQFVSAALRVSIRYVNTAMNVDNTDITFHEKVFNAIKSGNGDDAFALTEHILSDALSVIEDKM